MQGTNVEIDFSNVTNLHVKKIRCEIIIYVKREKLRNKKRIRISIQLRHSMTSAESVCPDRREIFLSYFCLNIFRNFMWTQFSLLIKTEFSSIIIELIRLSLCN